VAEDPKDKTIKVEDQRMLGSRMSFGDHLMELRGRLIKSLIGLAVAVVICLIFGDHIFRFLSKPLIIALQNSELPVQLYVTSLPEAFITYIRIAVYTGIFVSSPWIFYQMWEFVAAGLYAHERRYVHFFVPFSASLFILGGAFCLWIMAPVCCNYFIRFGTSIAAPGIEESFITRFLNKSKPPQAGVEVAPGGGQTPVQTGTPPPPGQVQPAPESQTSSPSQVPSPGTAAPAPPAETASPDSQPLIKPWFTLQSYVSFIIVMSLAFGLAFQVPLVVFILGRVNIVSLKTFQSMRKYAFFIILIAAAILTPGPDVLSQIALAIPMYILYEIGILMLMLWPKT
jgi:sec-independent protein translocase protein TatC